MDHFLLAVVNTVFLELSAFALATSVWVQDFYITWSRDRDILISDLSWSLITM